MSTLFMTVVEAGAIIVPMLNGLARGERRKPVVSGEAPSPAAGQVTANLIPATGDSSTHQPVPQGVTDRTRRDIADVTAFLGDRSERVTGERVQSTAFYFLYCEWKQERSETAITVAQFGVVLTKHLGLSKIKSDGKIWYLGVRLRHPAQGRQGAKHLRAVAA